MPNIYIGDAKGLGIWTQLLADDFWARLKARLEKDARDREIYDALKMKSARRLSDRRKGKA